MSCTDIEFRSQDAATGQLLSPAKDSKVHKCQVLEVGPQSILFLSFNELHFKKKKKNQKTFLQHTFCQPKRFFWVLFSEVR